MGFPAVYVAGSTLKVSRAATPGPLTLKGWLVVAGTGSVLAVAWST
jgi:hypothetical protein